jgi:hypothetical protein
VENRICFAIDYRRVHERFRRAGRVRDNGTANLIVVGGRGCQHLTRECSRCAWDGHRVWRIRHCQGRLRREEPGSVVPASEWIAPTQRVCRILVWHVDVREPEVAVAPSCREWCRSEVSVPGWVLRVELHLAWDERFVLDNQRDQMREITRSDAARSCRVCQRSFLGGIVEKITGTPLQHRR